MTDKKERSKSVYHLEKTSNNMDNDTKYCKTLTGVSGGARRTFTTHFRVEMG